jgi:hypothetical protein
MRTSYARITYAAISNAHPDIVSGAGNHPIELRVWNGIIPRLLFFCLRQRQGTLNRDDMGVNNLNGRLTFMALVAVSPTFAANAATLLFRNAGSTNMHLSLDGQRAAMVPPGGIAHFSAEPGGHLVDCRFDSGLICSLADTLTVNGPEQMVFAVNEQYDLQQAMTMTTRGELRALTRHVGNSNSVVLTYPNCNDFGNQLLEAPRANVT